MDIYQMSPLHGRMIVHNQVDAERNHEHGWKTVTKEEYYAGILEATDAVEDDVRANAIKAYTEKYGKAPHHRMKTETILAKLEDDDGSDE